MICGRLYMNIIPVYKENWDTKRENARVHQVDYVDAIFLSMPACVGRYLVNCKFDKEFQCVAVASFCREFCLICIRKKWKLPFHTMTKVSSEKRTRCKSETPDFSKIEFYPLYTCHDRLILFSQWRSHFFGKPYIVTA